MDEYKLYDNADWYFEETLKHYCFANKKEESALSDEDFREAEKWAGLHIAMFMTWIVRHSFESGLLSEIDGGEAALADLRAERITGSDFLEDHCDGKLHSENLSEEIIPFMEDFYGEYLRPFYADWVIDGIFDIPFEFGWSWDEYHQLEALLDERYNEYLEAARRKEKKQGADNGGGLLKKLFSGLGKQKT